jgi:cyclopropane-fatty-acyl-phospholipid synthase
MLAAYFFKHVITHGTLRIEDAKGETHVFAGGGGPNVAVKLKDPSLHWKLLTHPSLHIGMAYMDGTLEVTAGTLKELLEIILVSAQRLEGGFWAETVRRSKSIFYAPATINRLGRAERNVKHHYDLSAELYDQFLDRDRQYSCAYFRDPDDDLETAQLYKKQHLAAKLDIKPGQNVLDIGCGWGGLALFLAEHFDVTVTGVTLSDEQLTLARARAREAGLDKQVTFKLLDYREEPGRYDRIVSVGMFEHVGLAHFGEFFRHVQRLLKDDGIALIHTIGKQCRPGPINEWTRRYIFPGSYLPTLSQLAPIFEKLDLWLTDFESLRLHYAETLKLWNDRFQSNRDKVRDLYDDRFCRMWELYLQSCEAGFRFSGLTVFQLQISKQIDSVPLTRDYMFDAERDLIAQDTYPGHRLAGE